MRGRERDERRVAPAAARAAGGEADRRVGIEQGAAAVVLAAHRRQRGRVVVGRGLEELAQRGQRCVADGQRARAREPGELALRALGVAVVELEEQALEVRRDLDVHARAERRHDVAGLHAAGREQAREDVVGVGADHQARHGQARRARDPARQHVAEVAGRHGEREAAPAERARRPHVVGDLRGDPRPVDRVRGREPHALAELALAEQLLDDGLAVVERPVDRDGMGVRRVDGRHLPALHGAHAALGIEHDDVRAAAGGESRDRGGARVARRGDEHGDALVALRENVVEEAPDELQGEVLERQRGTVEELHEPLVGIELHERADRGVAEARVGLVAQPLEQRRLDLVARERRDDAGGDAGKGLTRPRGRQRRPALRHVEAAVDREPREQGVAEAERRRLAAGREVAHGRDRRGPPSGEASRRPRAGRRTCHSDADGAPAEGDGRWLTAHGAPRTSCAATAGSGPTRCAASAIARA